MKLKVNNVKKFAAMGLVLLEVGTFTGCKTTLNEVITYDEPDKVYETVANVSGRNIYEDLEFSNASEMETSSETISSISEERKLESAESLLEGYEKNPISSTNLNEEISKYYQDHIDELNDVLNPDYHEIHVKYGALVYQRLLNSGIKKEVILGELANVILEQQIPRCVSEEEWDANFGNIVSVLGETESMYEAYFCLSYLVHDELCDLEHTTNLYGAVTCDELSKAFEKKYTLN